MTISPRGTSLIAEFEAFRAHAYQDGAGIWTIGYGSTRINGVRVKPGDTITEPAARRALTDHCNTLAEQLATLITAPLSQNQIDAVLSLCYNIGIGAFRSSSLRQAINTRQPIDVTLFTRWNKIRNARTGALEISVGLTRRREREYAVFSQ